MSKICKWDYWYLCQFATETIETWQANISTCSTPMEIKIMFRWEPPLFQSRLTWFQHVSDFEFENHQTRPLTRPNIFISSLPHTDELPVANIIMEGQKVARKAFLLERARTQDVSMVTYCGGPLEQFYCNESTICDANWLRYLCLSY